MTLTASMFTGSARGLKWALRDVTDLDEVLAVMPQHRVAVQAGGCLGVYPKRLAQSFETVYVFEPSPELFPTMVENTPERNIVRFQAALGYHRQLVGVSAKRRDEKTLPEHEGLTHISGSGIVPTLRLDDLALPVCDLLCLDTEGYELFVLWGAQHTIVRCRPVLFLEINRNIRFSGFAEEDVRAQVRSLGYTFVMRLHADEVYVPEE